MALAQRKIDPTAEILGRIERYWDYRSSEFSKLRRLELQSENAAQWLKLLQEHLPTGGALNILDVGTGAGFFAILLAAEGHRVVGIDMSKDMVHEAKKNMLAAGCRAEFRRMNAEELDFPDEYFDAVISRNLTWTLTDVMEAYREWRRVLKPGGVLLNFDSDCGRTVFSKQGQQSCIHATLSREMLAECNAIKDELRISTHHRPEWDSKFLRSLGFSVECDSNVAPLVHRDQKLRYDAIPLFAIYAVK
ncbi:MAG: class I SAM-dependent methyltransferase [Selenomonadaceae bacterium]|nr:class I SAM-dependent methyltransferase [Selenomonadaceae bacterium]